MRRLALARIALFAVARSRRLIAAGQLEALLATPPAAGAHVRATAAEARRAVAWALGILRLVVRARLPGWRSTCLFRAVAECLVLRAVGRPAILRLGVARGSRDAVEAHAWAECDGVACLTADGRESERFSRLRPA